MFQPLLAILKGDIQLIVGSYNILTFNNDILIHIYTTPTRTFKLTGAGFAKYTGGGGLQKF
jgi:hypothetical protein